MKKNKYEKLVDTIIGGDFIDVDTLIELMIMSDWSADDVANELGEDFRDQYNACRVMRVKWG